MVTKNRSRELSPSVRLLVSECKLNCHWLVNIWSLSGSKIVKNRQQENFMKRTSGNYLQISSAPIRFYLASLKRGPWQIISQIMLWWIIFQGLYLKYRFGVSGGLPFMCTNNGLPRCLSLSIRLTLQEDKLFRTQPWCSTTSSSSSPSSWPPPSPRLRLTLTFCMEDTD